MSADGAAVIAELMPVPGYNMIDTAIRLTNCVNGCRRIKEPHKDVPAMLDLLFRLCGDDPSKLYLSETGREGAALVAKILHPQPCPPS